MDNVAAWCAVSLAPLVWVIGAVCVHEWWPSVAPRASMSWCLMFWPLALLAFVLAYSLVGLNGLLRATHVRRNPPIPQARTIDRGDP